jgi:WD repeat-containing protein 42A
VQLLLCLLPCVLGLQVVELNAIHVNPTRPWQFAVGGSDQWARVYDYRRPTRGSSAAAPAGRGAGGSHTGGVASSGGDSGPSGWSLADEPVARLCPQAVRQALASRRGGAGHKHITCVVWSQQGELLATYNDDVSVWCVWRGWRGTMMLLAPAVPFPSGHAWHTE